MPLYTLYPRRADGSSDTFISSDLFDDGEARIEALKILEAHATAAFVDVWRDDRKIHTRARMHPGLQAVLGRALAR